MIRNIIMAAAGSSKPVVYDETVQFGVVVNDFLNNALYNVGFDYV